MFIHVTSVCTLQPLYKDNQNEYNYLSENGYHTFQIQNFFQHRIQNKSKSYVLHQASYRKLEAKEDWYLRGGSREGVLGVLTPPPPPPFGVPPNFIKREKTPRACARKHRVLVLNSYPDSPLSEILYLPLYLSVSVCLFVINMATYYFLLKKILHTYKPS